MILVYAKGKVTQAQEGQRAREFGDSDSDYSVKTNGPNLGAAPADGGYTLKDGDILFVTKRGQAGMPSHTP